VDDLPRPISELLKEDTSIADSEQYQDTDDTPGVCVCVCVCVCACVCVCVCVCVCACHCVSSATGGYTCHSHELDREQ
jgi:hypothetical protein